MELSKSLGELNNPLKCFKEVKTILEGLDKLKKYTRKISNNRIEKFSKWGLQRLRFCKLLINMEKKDSKILALQNKKIPPQAIDFEEGWGIDD